MARRARPPGRCVIPDSPAACPACPAAGSSPAPDRPTPSQTRALPCHPMKQAPHQAWWAKTGTHASRGSATCPAASAHSPHGRSRSQAAFPASGRSQRWVPVANRAHRTWGQWAVQAQPKSPANRTMSPHARGRSPRTRPWPAASRARRSCLPMWTSLRGRSSRNRSRGGDPRRSGAASPQDRRGRTPGLRSRTYWSPWSADPALSGCQMEHTRPSVPCHRHPGYGSRAFQSFALWARCPGRALPVPLDSGRWRGRCRCRRPPSWTHHPRQCTSGRRGRPWSRQGCARIERRWYRWGPGSGYRPGLPGRRRLSGP